MRPIFILLFLLPDIGGLHRGILLSRDDRRVVIECGPAATGCGAQADAGPVLTDASGHFAPVFPGWGHYHFAVATKDDSAQYFFDQGLSLFYGYHLPESLASFREAARRDSGCVMAYWGEALAMGPYYNSAYFYKMPPDVLPVVEKMNELAVRAAPEEKDLISALCKRYSTDTTDSHRSELNHAYSQAMVALIPKYPHDNDVKALYIDGVMTEHAWDLWNNDGTPKPWTPGLVGYCEEILTADPYHPAALHYHIHLMEASRHPEVTLASAEKLKDLMPGVPHMVHMASHSYQRTGLYTKGVAINDSANAAQKNFSVLAPQLHLATSILHYHAVEAFCAMNGAMEAKAMRSAQECVAVVVPRTDVSSRAYLQYMSMMPVLVEIRLGRWQAILDRQEPDKRWVYAGLLSDFARGLAFVRMGHRDSAAACLESLRVKLKDTFVTVRQLPFNAPVEGATVAEGILAGELAFAEGKREEAMAAFERAILREDGMTYSEPKDCLIPARQYAGVCLLKMKKGAEAEKMYRADLVENPGNGWALLGLAQSLEMQHKKEEAAAYREKAKLAFAGAETMPSASVY